jgi:CRISPR-associated protein Csb1
VRAKDGIKRDGLLNLVALRTLAGSSEEETLELRRYILGLSLAAITAPSGSFLREGCLLVTAKDRKASMQTVMRNGVREDAEITASSALEYAVATAAAFGVGENWNAKFSSDRVKKSADESDKKKAAKRAKKAPKA